MENNRNGMLKFAGLVILGCVLLILGFIIGAYKPSNSVPVQHDPNPAVETADPTQAPGEVNDTNAVHEDDAQTEEPVQVAEQNDQPYYEPIPESLLPKPDKPSGTVVITGPELPQADTPSISGSEVSENDLANNIFKLINNERASGFASALTYNKKLQAAADLRAMECATLFSHTRPDGTSCHSVVTEEYRVTGENLIKADAITASPRAIVEAWMASAGHRDNIMFSSYTDTAIGVYEQDGVLYACQIFIG